MYPLAVLRRLAAETASVAGARTTTHRHLRDRIATAVLATLLVDVVAAIAVLHAERAAQGSDIHTYGQALFWTTTQLLTVSSSVVNPLTTLGRAIDVGLELWAITVVTTMAGAFGAFFHARSAERGH